MKKKSMSQKKTEQELVSQLSEMGWAITAETCTPGLHILTVTKFDDDSRSVAEFPTREQCLQHLVEVLP